MSQALNWNALFAAGQIVKLQTKKWTAHTKLKPQDVGIDDIEAVAAVMSLGRVRLLPTSAFRDINSAILEAKDSIADSSINFAMIKGARYIPESNMERLGPKLIQSKNRFLEAVEVLCNSYAEAREAHAPLVRQALEAAKSSDAALEMAYSRVMATYPTTTEVRNKFHMSWSFFGISGARSRAAIAALSDEQTEVKSIVSGMVTELRSEVQTKVEQLLKAATRGGKLNKKTLEGARAMVDKLETLNILGDATLATQLQALRMTFEGMETEKMDEEFSANLNAIKAELEATADQAILDVEASLTATGRRKLG